MKEFLESANKMAKDISTMDGGDVEILEKSVGISSHGDYGAKEYTRFINLSKRILFNWLKKSDSKGICKQYITPKYEPTEIPKKRLQIYDNWKEKWQNSVEKMTKSDVEKLFDEYDKVFFEGDIRAYISNSDTKLSFENDGTGTFSTEGLCFKDTCNYVITIPVKYFANIKQGSKTNVAGHQCFDQLECVQRVIEHELCHLIIFMFCSDFLVAEQHGELFMDTVRDLFGHTDYHHYIF